MWRRIVKNALSIYFNAAFVIGVGLFMGIETLERLLRIAVVGFVLAGILWLAMGWKGEK